MRAIVKHFVLSFSSTTNHDNTKEIGQQLLKYYIITIANYRTDRHLLYRRRDKHIIMIVYSKIIILVSVQSGDVVFG